MKKTVFSIVVSLVFLFSLTSTAFAAAGPVDYTIDVRNRTGAPVEFNYRGADGIIHWVTVPEGVSSLTLNEGVYSYWAAPSCGHIAGTMNISQQRDILMLDCSNATPSVTVMRLSLNRHALPSFVNCANMVGQNSLSGNISSFEYPFYDWNAYNFPDDWMQFGTFCYNAPAADGDSEWADIWYDGDYYYYEYLENGIDSSVYGNCEGWTDYGPGFYYLYFGDNGPELDC